MRIRFYFSLYLIFSLSLLLAGCDNEPSKAQMPDIGITKEEINTRLHLSAPQGWNTFKIGDDIGLSVDVVTDDQIAFQHDYGAKIFMLEDEKWKEVANFMKYPDGYLVLSQSNGDPFKSGSAVVDPILPELDEAITLRIILIGNIYIAGQITGEQTAGFIDVEIKPYPAGDNYEEIGSTNMK
jgi:hypothetical protein